MGKLDRIGSHELDLDAHTYNWWEKVITGYYMTPYPGVALNTTGSAVNADSLYATCPTLVARDMTFDRIAIKVVTAGAASTKARIGIYAVGTNMYPGALVLDAGEVAVDSTGVKAIVINQSLTKGLYYMAFISDGTPQPAYTYNSRSPLGIREGEFAYGHHMWRVAQAYGALPDPFTAGGGLYMDASPTILLRPSSLD